MANKKSKSKANSNGNRPHNGSRARKAHAGTARSVNARVGTAALGRSVEPSSASLSDRNIRTYSIPDYRLEHPDFTVHQSIEKDKDGTEHVRYEVEGDLDAPVPRIRDSKYLTKQQAIDIYRFMLLNRKMEVALENLYKQGKVVGGVYFGLGPGGLFLRLGICARQRRLVRAHDP